MGLLDSLQSAGRKAMINTEIAMTERNIQARKRSFGVQWYDIIVGGGNNNLGAIGTGGSQHGLSPELNTLFQDTEKEIQVLLQRRAAKQQELDVVTANKDRNAFKQTALERTGQWISDSGSEAKLGAEIALLSRSIQQLKEKLGVAIFDHVTSTKRSSLNQLHKLSAGGRELEKCIQQAKQDVEAYEATKQRKLRELYNQK